MTVMAQWLGARPHRGTIVNIVMLVALLTLIGSTQLYLLVGGGVGAMAAAYFLVRAGVSSAQTGGEGQLYRLALIWIPGVLAIALLALGLYLLTANPMGPLGHSLGLVLFPIEISMLTLAGVDLSPGQPDASLEGVA